MKSFYAKTAELLEWKDNPVKRSKISDKDLEDSIRENGVKKALDVIKQNGRYLVVDGNRRFRVARRLGVPELYVNLHDDSDPVRLAVLINTNGSQWDQQTLGQLVSAYPEALAAVPANYRKRLASMIALLGDEFADFITNYSPNVYVWGLNVAACVGRKDDKEFAKKAIFWVGRHKLLRIIRQAIDVGTPPAELEKAIRQDRPLRFAIG